MRVHGILQNDKERKKRVIELLERISLNESHFYRYPHEFSGGQRQRLSIARAILKNPQIIVLDEATSALDNESELLFQEALLPYIEQHTGIIIAHRLSTIRFADHILFLKDGQVVEFGSHDELMAKKGDYYQFCITQQMSE